MKFTYPVTIFIIIAILLLIISAALLFGSCSKYKEGLTIVPIATDSSTKKIVNGYYQVDDKNMAVIPYGFVIDPSNNRNIIPRTKVAYSMLTPKTVPSPPKRGEKLEDGFYFSTEPY